MQADTTQPYELFGVRLIGLSPTTIHKLLLTAGVIVALWLVSALLRFIARSVFRDRRDARTSFWTEQAVHILVTILLVVLLVSIWFDDPGRIGTMAGLVTAGLAVALQRLVTAVAAYFIILRGTVFNVGDRIVMGEVRGDVVALGFVRTTILEMGQPPPVQKDDPAIWVAARQYTGRVVTVTNDKIFDTPVYNYSRDFSYIWEELHIPVKYGSNRQRAEELVLQAVQRGAGEFEEDARANYKRLEEKYFIAPSNIEPKVFYRLTDNWIELSVRFLVPTHGVREIKDRISRMLLESFEAEGIEIASATFEIVGAPPIRIENG